MSVAGLKKAAHETVAGLPREFWWLWTSTLVNRLGAFVATFMALYLTLDRATRPRTPVSSPHSTGSAGSCRRSVPG